MNYTIDPVTFAISIFVNGESVPFQFQPDYPNGDKFDSYAEAEAWAQTSIQAHDPAYGFFAPSGKNLAQEAKPTPAQILESKLTGAGLTVAELKQILGLV